MATMMMSGLSSVAIDMAAGVDSRNVTVAWPTPCATGAAQAHEVTRNALGGPHGVSALGAAQPLGPRSHSLPNASRQASEFHPGLAQRGEPWERQAPAWHPAAPLAFLITSSQAVTSAEPPR
jgi:hypothetical protein